MKYRAPPKTQRGIALFALLVIAMLAGGYAFYRSANLGSSPNKERDTVLLRLVQAKEALIAYAVNDATRPGRLLCPDIVGDGVSPLLTRDDCTSYGGWLPWKTLDLAENSDSQGQKFRYFLSPSFGGQSSTVKLNSDTLTSLRLDVPAGSISNDIAAVIIAQRGELDPANDDGDNYFYNGSPDDAANNDIVVAITRQELMAAVEQRIANELRSCLEQHANSADNPQHTYPWPAPLSNAIFKGATKSLFGMVPDTQAGNLEAAQKESIIKLTMLQNSLNSGLTAEDQLTAAKTIQAEAAYARALFDRQYLLAVDLSNTGQTVNSAFKTLSDSIRNANAAQIGTLPTAIESAAPSLTAFIDSLKNNGFDLFLMEMEAHNPKMKSLIDSAEASASAAAVTALIAPINLFRLHLLQNSGSPNEEINALIVKARTAASDAYVAVDVHKDAPNDAQLMQAAINKANDLVKANQDIVKEVLASRLNLDPSEISFQADSLKTATQVAIAGSFSPQALAALDSTLGSAQTQVASLTGGLAPRNAALASSQSLESARSAVKAGDNPALIQLKAEEAAAKLNILAIAMANNGDNIALESLKAFAAALNNAQKSPPNTLGAWDTLNKLQVSAVSDWSDLAVDQAADLARKARKGITSQEDSKTSAYTGARKLLDSLDGENGSLALLEKYIKTSDSTDARKAQDALTNSQSLLANLLLLAASLDSTLEAGMAEAATPTIWHGSACQFLKPPTGSSSWWTANEWKNLFFYQISDRVRPSVGQLTVNGSGNYRTVTIAAGKALTENDRVARKSANRRAENYLDGKNADISRDGDAQSPSPRLFVEPVSPTFNDHLAY